MSTQTEHWIGNTPKDQYETKYTITNYNSDTGRILFVREWMKSSKSVAQKILVLAGEK